MTPTTVTLRTPPVAARHRAIRRQLSWPLAAILAVQAAFSLSLVWSNTAFSDEANYLLQGKLELASWLHHTPVPTFNDSGAPQIYPVIGYLADAIGGLAAARILSLMFMLTATILLYLTTRRLFGATAAIGACAIWALTEPVLRLTFATYDPLACLLVILSVYLLVQSTFRDRPGDFIGLAAVALAIGCVTAVSFAIYAPVVVAIAFTLFQANVSLRSAIVRTAWFGGSAAVITLGLATKFNLWSNAIGSTISRHNFNLGQGITGIVRAAWSWDGLLLGIAAAGVILAFGIGHRYRYLLAACLAGGLIVTAYQAHIGTGWSLDKHVSAGTGMAAIAAGYAVSAVSLPYLTKTLRIACAAVLVAVSGITGLWYARSAFHFWPNVSPVVSAIRPTTSHGGSVLSASIANDTGIVLEYYLIRGDHWQSWLEVSGSKYQPGIPTASYNLVVFTFSATLNSASIPTSVVLNQNTVNSQVLKLAAGTSQYPLVRQVEASHRYHIWKVIPYTTSNPSISSGIYVIWQRNA